MRVVVRAGALLPSQNGTLQEFPVPLGVHVHDQPQVKRPRHRQRLRRGAVLTNVAYIGEMGDANPEPGRPQGVVLIGHPVLGGDPDSDLDAAVVRNLQQALPRGRRRVGRRHLCPVESQPQFPFLTGFQELVDREPNRPGPCRDRKRGPHQSVAARRLPEIHQRDAVDHRRRVRGGGLGQPVAHRDRGGSHAQVANVRAGEVPVRSEHNPGAAGR